MWNLYRSNCKLSKYILTAITTQSLFPLVEHKTGGLDALWRRPGRCQVPIFAPPPRHEARRAVTKMFITYRSSLYDFFCFFPFPLRLAPSIITSSQGLICIHSHGAALSPGRLKWWRAAIVKGPRLRKTCAIKLSALPFRSQDGRFRLDTSVIALDIQDASWRVPPCYR